MWVLDSQRPVFKSLLCHLQPVGLGEVYLEAQFLLQGEDKKKKKIYEVCGIVSRMGANSVQGFVCSKHLMYGNNKGPSMIGK